MIPHGVADGVVHCRLMIFMEIDESTVDYLSKLARINFSKEEKGMFLEHLSEIVNYVEKLNELDTENISPTPSVISVRNVFREDEVKPSLSQDAALKNAPCRQGGFFKVPKVI